MIHLQNVIKHAKSKKTGPSDKERTFTCLGCYAVNPWTRTLSIWQKISLHGGGDIRFMGSPFILCHPAGLRIGLISSKYWFSQKINSQNLCTEFTSSNKFMNNVIGADDTVKFAVLSDNSWLWTSYRVKWITKVYINTFAISNWGDYLTFWVGKN